MAKQTGLVRYSGSMGGVRHFKIKGLDGDFAGLNGGPSADQIANDPAFIRTRENMSEFGGCATAAKSIRVGLAQIIKQMGDPQLTGRLTAIMKQINLQDTTGVRGQRAVTISANRTYLENVDFNKSIGFSGIFNAPYTLTANGSRNGATFTVAAFDPSNLIIAPAGATHFRLLNAITVVSDYTYNSTSGQYEPTSPNLSELSDIQYSSYLDLSTPGATATITTSLPGSPAMTTDTSVLNCIGIEFYQQIGSNYYLFSSGNALHIEDVF